MPPAPWLMEIPNTQFSIRFSNYGHAIAWTAAVDIIVAAQLEILAELTRANPPKDVEVGQSRVWTTDLVYLTLNADDMMLHSVCGMFMAAMIITWGNEYGFYSTEMDFVRATVTGWTKLGSGKIGGVIGTAVG